MPTTGSEQRPIGANQQLDASAPRAQTLDSGMASSQSNAEEPGSEVQDPLAHMTEIDKFGLKGFSYMMNNFPDYTALVTGSDVANLGFDLNSSEYAFKLSEAKPYLCDSDFSPPSITCCLTTNPLGIQSLVIQYPNAIKSTT